jgi:hypothetical protein
VDASPPNNVICDMGRRADGPAARASEAKAASYRLSRMPMPSTAQDRKYQGMACAIDRPAQPSAPSTAPSGMTRCPPQRSTAMPASGDTRAITTMAAEKPP